MATHPIRYRLPVSYSTEIGRIMTRWAILEWRLRVATYMLLDVGPKEGRIAVREPRPQDYGVMLRDLMQIKGFKPTKIQPKDLGKAIDSMAFYRNALAHGIWLKVKSRRLPWLQVLAGSYPPSPGAKAVKAKIDPQGVEISPTNLREIRAGIESATGMVNVLIAELEARLSPSPQKSAGQPG